MDSTREAVKQALKNNLYIELPDHTSLTDPTKFRGFVKILDTDLDRVADIIIDITKSK